MAANAVGGLAGTTMPQVTSSILQQQALATPTIYSFSSATALQQQQQFAQAQMASVMQSQVLLEMNNCSFCLVDCITIDILIY